MKIPTKCKHMENGVLPFTEQHALELAQTVVSVKSGAA